MAAITFNVACLRTQLLAHAKTVLAACRALLDAFVSSRTQHAAAGNVRPRQPRGTPPVAAADQSGSDCRTACWR
jgi:hypothetical protein